MDGPSSPATPDPPVAHVADLVARAAARVSDHPAVVDVTSGWTLTWAELDAVASAEADRLAAAGVAAGDRVVVRLGGGALFCVAVLGALRAGAVVVPYGPIAVRRELDAVLADCGAAAVVTADGDDEAGAAAGTVGARLLRPPDLAARAPGRPGAGGGEDLALLVYPSTAGSPRGVCLPHRALLANRAQAGALRPAPVTPVDRVLLAQPLFHVRGFAAGLLQVCWAGATVVLAEQLDPDAVARLLTHQRVSVVAGVPSLYRALLDLPPDALRTATAGVRVCTAGGAPLPPAWLAAFRDATGLAVVEDYGLTEGGPILTTNRFDAPPKPGSVGRPLPGVELRLVDADGRPVDTPPEVDPDDPDDYPDEADGTGFVAVRGPNLFSGYWPDRDGGPDDEGWFRTADVGFLDAEGDLHLVGRSSDLVIVNGFNVFPREVEQVLVALPGVAEAAVVGVPDDRSGEAVKAVLVREPDSTVTEEEVRVHCATRLARFKVPAEIVFTGALPRTPTGKIARARLAKPA